MSEVSDEQIFKLFGCKVCDVSYDLSDCSDTNDPCCWITFEENVYDWVDSLGEEECNV